MNKQFLSTGLIIFLLFSASCVTRSPVRDIYPVLDSLDAFPPVGYRLPQPGEYVLEWNTVFTGTLADPFYQTVDFNGDHTLDYVIFLFPEEGAGYLLACLLSSSKGYRMLEMSRSRETPQQFVLAPIDNFHKIMLYSPVHGRKTVFSYDRLKDEFIEESLEND